VHVEDLASAHLLALEALQPGIGFTYNLGTGQGYSVQQVLRACEQITGRSIPSRHCPRRAGDPPALVASADKIQRELNWQPRHSDLNTIVASAWAWHQAHPNGYHQDSQQSGMRVAI
jgi:UDP-glucose 4-epimerase